MGEPSAPLGDPPRPDPFHLALVPSEEMLSELSSRFEDWCFIGHYSHTHQQESTLYRYGGNWFTLLGMLARAGDQMQREMDEGCTHHGMEDG